MLVRIVVYLKSVNDRINQNSFTWLHAHPQGGDVRPHSPAVAWGGGGQPLLVVSTSFYCFGLIAILLNIHLLLK